MVKPKQLLADFPIASHEYRKGVMVLSVIEEYVAHQGEMFMDKLLDENVYNEHLFINPTHITLNSEVMIISQGIDTTTFILSRVKEWKWV